MTDDERIKLLIASIQLFGNTLTEGEFVAVKKALFEALNVELPEASPEEGSFTPLIVTGGEE